MATETQVFANKVVSVNPATGEMLCELECASELEVQQAVARARASQPAFAELGIRRRMAILKKFQRLLQERKSRVADLISNEAGKPCVEALTTEMIVVLDAARFYIDEGYKLLRDES